MSEVNEATNILLEAMAADWGPIAQHGRLHDRASYRYYWTVLQRAKLAGLALPDAAAAAASSAGWWAFLGAILGAVIAAGAGAAGVRSREAFI